MRAMANDSTVATWLDVWERAAAAHAAARADVLAAQRAAGTASAVSALPLGERDALLLDLRALLFGTRLHSTAACPACSERCEWDCELDALRAASISPASDGEFELVEDGWRIRARAVTSADLAAIASCADESAALRALLRRCVHTALHADREVDAAELPTAWVERLSEALATLDPQAATSVALQCPACAHGWEAAFDIGTYLFTELDAWAQRTLADVHELAIRYGWSEPEILALSPARRARYLALACA
jgi:hypothetical protein